MLCEGVSSPQRAPPATCRLPAQPSKERRVASQVGCLELEHRACMCGWGRNRVNQDRGTFGASVIRALSGREFAHRRETASPRSAVIFLLANQYVCCRIGGSLALRAGGRLPFVFRTSTVPTFFQRNSLDTSPS